MRRGKIYDWFPMWRNKWLQGSTRFELDPDERSVFVDFLCLGAADDGFIRANPTTPYPIKYLAVILQVPEELLVRTIEKCIALGKLKRFDDGILYVLSWADYQLDPRRKREVMEGQEEKKTHTLDEYREVRPCLPEMRRELGAEGKSALDQEIVKARATAAESEAEMKKGRG